MEPKGFLLHSHEPSSGLPLPIYINAPPIFKIPTSNMICDYWIIPLFNKGLF